MNRVTLQVEGMMCGMCEAHVADAIRDVCEKGAKVSVSRSTGTAQILMKEQPDVARIRTAVKNTGYRVTGVRVEQS